MKLLNPYAGTKGLPWLRGNLHTHTTASDGERPIQAVIRDYARRGYDFLMVSDHDILTSVADYARWDHCGLVLIPGNEVTRNGPHLLHVDADRLVAPTRNRQRVIDAINRGRGFAIINHPNWLHHFNHCTFEQLSGWQGYVGLEIYNGTIGRLDGSAYATDKWDRLLSAGRRIWGFANDDSHLRRDDVGLGWNLVASGARTAESVLTALRSGAFQASTGIQFDSIEVRGNRIRVKAGAADRIVAIREVGRRFAQAEGTSLSVTVPPDAKYIRFEAYGRGEAMAWTQPFFTAA